MKIDGIEHHEISYALSYLNKRTFLKQFDFQPINRYYNVHEIKRSEFSNKSMKILFEEKKDSYEIKLLIFDTNESQIEFFLTQLFPFRERLIIHQSKLL